MSDDFAYLDWAATTPLRPEVLAAMIEAAPLYANPSSVHTPGREVRELVDAARATVATALGADPKEIIFTSGASESCNLAIKGLLFEHLRHPKLTGKPHIITSAFEHHAVLEPIEWLEKLGFIDATIVRPDDQGIVHPEAIAEAIQPNTILVSVMWVNNEIGTIQPLAQRWMRLTRHQQRLTDRLCLHLDDLRAVGQPPQRRCQQYLHRAIHGKTPFGISKRAVRTPLWTTPPRRGKVPPNPAFAY